MALCPHETLDMRGKGLRFNFVSNSSRHDISDQLVAFSSVAPMLKESFPGTIIRIPFRTPEQAELSEISKLIPTPKDISAVFKEFQNDVTESIVFLKSIEKVEFYMDGQRLGHTNIRNSSNIRDMRASIKSAISSMSSVSNGFEFEIEQEFDYSSQQTEASKTVQMYYVQQRVFDPESNNMSKELRDWATRCKMVSWIALAVRIDDPEFSIGRVFVTLPLPVPLDDTRVNVHSIFALKRDRRSLWTDNDSDGDRSMNEILWNNFLVRNLMPSVWHDLLVNLARYTSVYNYFPFMPITVGSLFNTLAESLIKQILNEKSAIWRTSSGHHVPIEMGFIVSGQLKSELLVCFQDLGMPIFEEIPGKILNLVKRTQHPHFILNTEVARIWLRQYMIQNKVSLTTAITILEYISQDEQMDQLYDLALFACRNGKLRSLSKKGSNDDLNDFKTNLYIGTSEESGLFDEKGELFLMFDGYPPTVITRIRTNISMMSASLNLEKFSIHWFERYAQDVLFSHPDLGGNEADIISTSMCEKDMDWIQKLWNWLDTQHVTEVERVVSSLWLIPLEGGETLHKV